MLDLTVVGVQTCAVASSFDCFFKDGPATPSVSVTVKDDDGGSGSDSLAVTVNNVAPTVHLSGPAAVDESTVTARHYSFNTTDPRVDTIHIEAKNCGVGVT